MIVLGIETSGARLGAALVGPAGPMAEHVAPGARRHTEQLAPAIVGLCRQVGIRPADLDAVAVDVGPGLFTGLRVGIATAAALTAALGIPAVGLTSTDVLAEPHHRPDRVVVAVVDVRRGELAWARYAPGGGPPVDGPALTTGEELARRLAGDAGAAGSAGEVLVVGDGAAGAGLARLPGVTVDPTAQDPATAHPSAVVLAGLARRRLLEGSSEGAAATGDLAPCYLREADVRIGWASHDQPAAVGR